MLSFNSEKYLLSHENDCLNEISYTWKDSYCLPFETAWARIAKFSYLNGLSWSYVQQKTKLRNYICTQFEKEIDLNIPDFFSKKKIFEDFKICPECMKYGYQSVLHQIKGLDFCFLHKCSLITVSPKQLESSKYGTYEFIEIKTENLIKNIELYSLLQEYIEKIQKEQLLDTKFILPQSNNDSIIRPCSENTERLFHRMVLLQDEVEIYGCKCIQNLKIDSIDAKNERLAKEILKSFAKYNLEYNNLRYFINDFEEAFLYMQTIFLRERSSSSVPYQLTEEVLGWCVFKIIWDVIENLFGGYDEWEKTVYAVNGDSKICMTTDNIDKYAVVLAYQAITSATSASKVVCPNCRLWFRNTNICNFGLNVYEELGDYCEPHWVHVNNIYRKATQYIVFPIINDLFEDLTNQAYIMFKNAVIQLKPDNICELTPDIWRVPQYVVLYYRDRTEIYKCEPDEY